MRERIKPIFILLLATNFSYAQSLYLQELEKKEEDIKRYQKYSQQSKDVIDRELAKASDLQSEKKTIIEENQQFEKQIEQLPQNLASITNAAEKFHAQGNGIIYKVSRKKKYYDCVIAGLKNEKIYKHKSCHSQFPAKLTSAENYFVRNATALIPDRTVDQIKTLIEENKKRLDKVESEIIYHDEYAQKEIKNLERLQESIEIKKNELTEAKGIATHSFMKCDATMPTIDLEAEYIYEGSSKKGPYVGIPRDNQDGLGTCYANAAKNMLVAVSDGTINASFLDVALQYKNSVGQLESGGLEAGGGCTALEKLNETGICPQKYSPAETGELNPLFEGLFSDKVSNVYDQASTIQLVKRFLDARQSLEKSDFPFAKDVLKNIPYFITQLKNNPNIKVPLPTIDIEVFGKWKIREAYHTTVKNQFSMTEKEFEAEYQAIENEFNRKVLTFMLNDVPFEEVVKEYESMTKDFYKNYGLEQLYQNEKHRFVDYAQTRYLDGKTRKELVESLDFLKRISQNEELSKEEFIVKCKQLFDDGFNFLRPLSDLVEKMSTDNIDESILFDENGKLKENSDLMQLAVAPACINKENRIKLPFQVYCNGNSTYMRTVQAQEDQADAILSARALVLGSLLNGRAVGNSFDTPRGGHINTIVGLRYNPDAKRCEVKIRESQTGTSGWHDEKHEYLKANQLVTVGKK